MMQRGIYSRFHDKCIFQYIRLQLKKFLLVLRGMLFRLLLAIVGIVLLIMVLSGLLQRPGQEPPIKVALVIAGQQDDVKFISEMLMMMDSIKNTVKFVYVPEEEAEDMIQAGQIQAAIFLGEDFYQDVNGGTNTPVTVWISHQEPAGLKLFMELLNDGIFLIDVTESASYAMNDAWKESYAKVSRTEMLDKIMDTYVAEAFSIRDNVEIQILSPTGEVDLAEYYAVVGLLLFLLIFGVGFWGLYQGRDTLVEKRLRLHGVGMAVRVFLRLLFMTAGFWLEMLIGIGILHFIGEVSGLFAVEITLGLLGGLLLPAMMLSCIYHGCFSLGNGAAGRRRILIYTMLLLLVASGCLVPLIYLPEWIRACAGFLPFQFLRAYLETVLFGQGAFPSINIMMGMLAFSILFLGIGVLYEWMYRDTVIDIFKQEDARKNFRRAAGGTVLQRVYRAFLFLKWQWKKKSPVIELVLLICLAALVCSIRFPKQTDEILLCESSGAQLQEDAGLLVENSLFSWKYEDDGHAAKDAVCKGEALAAVVTGQGQATVYVSAFTPQIMVARETLAIALFAAEQRRLLGEGCQEYFSDGESMAGQVFESYQEYMQGGKIFRVMYQAR